MWELGHSHFIRLWGIDAPESTQLRRGDDSANYRCGAKAANDLDAFIGGWLVSCAPVSLDQYRRTFATCRVDGVDLGEWLVRQGLALDWPRYSNGRYRGAENDAAPAGRGISAGSYVDPWLYRGEDLRRLPLSMRKTILDRLLARRPAGIFVAPFEQGEIGPDLFRAACDMGLEGLVSKRRDRPYQGG